MCGVAGLIDHRLPAEELRSVAATMASTLAHRGPDDQGVWIDGDHGVGLGHRRLSIIDLSPAGHQPMQSADRQLTLTFNGEIYNYRDLRTRLSAEGVRFRSASDTEVLVEAVSCWGIERALSELVGMFAFAVWDDRTATLTLARDRMGEKPLYYGLLGGRFVFASELRTIREALPTSPDIDRSAVAALLRYGYVPAPLSIYEGIHKLPAASTVSFRPGDRQLHAPRPYWSLAAVVAAGVVDRSPQGHVAALERALHDSVAGQMIADVPLGAFLSGGIDSSLVVASMQAQASQPVRTFSIGFAVDGYDEAPHARAVAKHLGTDHTELYVTPQEAMDVVPRLPQVYDEPFADSSQLPTTLVTQMARRHVTVALSGDGGDELFAGYTRYRSHARMWGRNRWVPRTVRRLAAGTVRAVPVETWDRMAGILPPGRAPSHLGDKAHKLAELLDASGPDEGWTRMMSLWTDPGAATLSHGDGLVPPPLLPRGLDEAAAVMALDALTYLPDDILVKVDRAAMAVSLETRVPLLDHRVVEVAWSMPLAVKTRHGQSKWPLRTLLRRHVPDELVHRPKMGFGVPIGEWLRGPLRPWAEDLLAPTTLARQGLLDQTHIDRHWRQHQGGTHDWKYRLWAVLMLQAWLAEHHPEL